MPLLVSNAIKYRSVSPILNLHLKFTDAKFDYNKRSYYVVLDHIIKSDNIGAIDGSHFISGGHKITDSLKVSFINDYKITDKTNPKLAFKIY
jgi:hypothetical protein